jgi:hypothetical protein
MFRGNVGALVKDTDPFYILMTPAGTLIRIKGTKSHGEFDELWTGPCVSFPVTESVRMWYESDDEYTELINSGASALVNGLLGEKLETSLTIYGCVIFTGSLRSTPSLATPRELSLENEALVGVYAKLVTEMESTYNA